MTGNPPQPGETPQGQGSPWAPPGAGEAWWREPAAEPPAAPAGLPPEQRADRPVTTGELMIIEPAARPVGSPVPASPPADGSLGYGPPASDPPTSGPPPSGPPPSGPPPSGPPPAGPPAEVLAAPEVEERLANSPFWMSDEERAAAEATQPLPAPRPRRPAANPLSALLCLIVLSLAAAFFGWVSAEPFWLAVGHGDRGYAVTTSCHGSGLTQRCVGEFATDGFSAGPVTLLGIAGDGRRPGAVSSARMVGPGSDQAYTAGPGPLMHLRWGLGFLLVLLCGHGIAATTGARRLPSRPARRGATIASFLGPLLLLGGFLVAAY